MLGAAFLLIWAVLCIELRMLGPWVVYINDFGFLNKLAGMRLGGISWFWPTVIVKRSERALLTVEHEKIHFNHQCEMLVIPFYLVYGGFYGYLRVLRRMAPYQAYMKNPMERAAYALDKRPYSWVFYLGSVESSS